MIVSVLLKRASLSRLAFSRADHLDIYMLSLCPAARLNGSSCLAVNVPGCLHSVSRGQVDTLRLKALSQALSVDQRGDVSR